MGKIGLGTILGIGAQMAANAQNNWANQQLNYEQYQQQQHLMSLQYGYNEQAAQNADERARAMYTDLQSPNAMVNQINQAGLSPGLIYGQSGMGGQLQQGAQGGGANIPSRQVFGMNPLLDAQTAVLAATAEKTKAETKNIESGTEKNKAETASTWRDLPIKEKQLIVMDTSIDRMKSDIEVNNKEIEKLAQDIQESLAKTELAKDQSKLTQAQTEVQKALKEWQDAQTKLTNLQIKWTDKLNQAQIDQMRAAARQANAAADKFIMEAKKTGLEAQVISRTMNAQVNKIILEYTMAKAEAMVWPQQKYAELNKLRAETEKMDWETATEKQKTEFFQGYDDLFGPGFGGMMRTIVENIWPNFGAGQVSKP